MCSSRGYPPIALAIRFFSLLVAYANANFQEATPRAQGPYGLQSWTQEPIFVDEPRWILMSHRTPAQSDFNDEADNHFWVTRGRKRNLHSPRPPTVLDTRVRYLFADDVGDEDSWVLRGKKSTFSGILENEPFWAKKADAELQTHRGKRKVLSEVGDTLNRDPSRDKKGDLTSALSNGDQFWVNRGKKDLQSVLEGGDTFWVNRGKKSDLESALKGGDTFWVNRGKKNELQSILNSGDQFWVNRGKKNELESILNNGDPFWVNRGKKEAFQGSMMGMSEGQSPDDANIGGQPDASSLTFKNYPSLFWSNSGWNDRLKKDPLKTILKPDPFFVNRGKKSLDKSERNINETRSRDQQDRRTKPLPWETQFFRYNWLERGKKTNDRPENLDPFWVTRGKRIEMHNRQRRDVSESTTKTSLKNAVSSRQKRMAKSPRMIPSYDKDYPFKKVGDVNSLLLWWKDKSAPYEMQDEEQILGIESMVIRRLGENIAKVEPFWVNRGKKNVALDQVEFLDDVPVKRREAVPSDVVGDLGALTQPGETFWVARG